MPFDSTKKIKREGRSRSKQSRTEVGKEIGRKRVLGQSCGRRSRDSDFIIVPSSGEKKGKRTTIWRWRFQ